MSNPKIQVDMACPKCGSEQTTTALAAPDGGFLVTCFASYAHKGEGKISWVVYPKKGMNAPTGLTSEGVTTNLVDPILEILQKLPQTWIEYGVIEYQLRLDFPELFAQHVAERGHVMTGQGQATASAVRFPTALLRLESIGTVAHRMGPATGEWAYNQEVSYWTLLPEPSQDIPPLTWAARAAGLGRDVSDKWSAADVAAVEALVVEHVSRHRLI